MNFSGWVAIPRTILNNTHTGRLTNNEQLVLITLTLLADSKTGSGYINAAAIRAYLPELNYDRAKRVLKSLEDKRLLYRQIKHQSNDLYHYWVDGYQVSDGVHRLLWTNLSEVFETKDVSRVRYEQSPPAAPPADYPAEPPADYPAIHPATAPNNNHDKDKQKDNDKDTLPPNNGDGESLCDSKCEAGSDERSEPLCDTAVISGCADGDTKCDTDDGTGVSGECADELPTRLAERYGLEFRDGAYLCHDGEPVHPNAVAFMQEQMRTICS